MEQILLSKLHNYIATNNPDLLLSLQQETKVNDYLQQKLAAVRDFLAQLRAEGKPASQVEDLALAEMTRDLRPSRYNYLAGLLAAVFAADHHRMVESGTLTYEITRMITECQPIFDASGFSVSSEQDPSLRLAIIGQLKKYLEKNNAPPITNGIPATGTPQGQRTEQGEHAPSNEPAALP